MAICYAPQVLPACKIPGPELALLISYRPEYKISRPKATPKSTLLMYPEFSNILFPAAGTSNKK